MGQSGGIECRCNVACSLSFHGPVELRQPRAVPSSVCGDPHVARTWQAAAYQSSRTFLELSSILYIYSNLCHPLVQRPSHYEALPVRFKAGGFVREPEHVALAFVASKTRGALSGERSPHNTLLGSTIVDLDSPLAIGQTRPGLLALKRVARLLKCLVPWLPG